MGKMRERWKKEVKRTHFWLLQKAVRCFGVFFLFFLNTCGWAEAVGQESLEEPQEKGAGARGAGTETGSSVTASGLHSRAAG